MSLENYILNSENKSLWFVDEVEKSYNVARISNVINNKNYLQGNHKVKQRENSAYKGKEYITRKTLINYAKTVINFHNTFIVGKQVSIIGDEKELVDKIRDIYKKSNYALVDYKIVDRVNKFGDAYEVMYISNGLIKSKVIDSADAYPVYDDNGDYIAFIEYYTDSISNISYYNVFTDNKVEKWNNATGGLNMVESYPNLFGLPIHYHNLNDTDDNFGVSTLNDIIPLIDELEDILSKMGDAIYTNSLNPLPVAIGQRIDSSISADAIGYILNLDGGDFKIASTTMDYSTIKLYLDNIKQFLNDISCIPSALSGNANIANVSEVSLSLLFHMALIKSDETEKWLRQGLNKRINRICNVLNSENNIDIVFNLNLPSNEKEVVEALATMRGMGAISVESIIQRSGMFVDSADELSRINSEATPINIVDETPISE